MPSLSPLSSLDKTHNNRSLGTEFVLLSLGSWCFIKKLISFVYNYVHIGEPGGVPFNIFLDDKKVATTNIASELINSLLKIDLFNPSFLLCSRDKSQGNVKK